ncbi:DUF4397 domain-containing protein [Pseudoflavitalea sp. X16]|uniref:DUF4397 domain-containing protein n=1 Tax=Paraflavitalea devenefica TaxID=2716334 RepID=UPI00141EF578|nr:DUF4397 domain-containing protein [Paraflavitalea devenefica]NII27769.1 DUF4397 domain-containing protein [Paraflavitalea devenefica]
MRNIPIGLLVVTLLAYACKKETFTTTPVASLKIINTVTGGSIVKLGSYPTNIANNAHADFGLFPDSTIYVYPNGDSLHPWYNHASKDVLIEENQYYSLFLGGTPTDVTAKLIKENIPVRADSTAGIRFIHLSPNSGPVNVVLSTTPQVSEFFNIGYGEITDFKSFPATAANTSYTFQIINPSTNKVITSITMTGATVTTYVPRFKNVTLVFRGKTTGTPAAGITRVNHY